ncbi:UDP-glycosyltransferase 83A1-like isoform X3 [Olea europaea var. sylvestris]|uniref:UDP-glycosyltransferase 83A1-like isoform X3 n=1 Tax=Olea europaea var. sylvestris TaxID=158386 RepID=UPI000C1D4ED1|nr:UDP-glycosyltransferase 83A1-like isoform X3 [Olea europaea var. sylvestris]
MRKPHILIIPFPAQGHVIPAMELALNLAEHGCKITFVNTEFNHERVMKSLPEADSVRELVQMVSLPDGLKPSDDRDDIELLWESIFDVMPGELVALIQRINGSESEKVSCLIADVTMAWALEVAEEMGIKKAAFWPAAVALLALILEIPRLTEDGILDSDGQPMKMQSIQLSPTMPFIKPTDFHWNCAGDHKREKGVFKFFVKVIKPTKLAERLICNSSNCLESGTFASYPDFLAIGPLLASNRLGKSTGSFWQEDSGFKERLDRRGCIVNWAPQQKVLSHPSIACFISHCGWNSTLEGISNGIPFLCWPYFGDQLFNQSYICDYLKIGLELNKDENGIIRRDEIKNKLERVLGDEGFKERVLDLQAKILNSVRKGGSSHKNFEDFLSWIKD